MLRAGLVWPNPGCPVMMVECEQGVEEKSSGGSVKLATVKKPQADSEAAEAAIMAGTSFYNRTEAVLAVR